MSGLYPFVIVCKGCRQKCGQKRRYLPTDIFRGRLSHDLLAKLPRGVGQG
jgi:hypothetical protein